MKENKKMLILTSIMTLLPMGIGLCLWNRLPEQMATHFGMNGVANGWSGKLFTVVGLPLILLGIHLVCVLVTLHDPKRRGVNKKMFTLIFWLTPVISWVVSAAVYGYALDMEINMEVVSLGMIGVIFLVIGNYLPKCRQNYTVGIKLPWTLHDEDNWNKTHRLGGKLYVLVGCVMLINMFLQNELLILLVILIAAFVPTGYSFALYKGWVK